MIKMRILLDSAKIKSLRNGESKYSFRRVLRKLVDIVMIQENGFQAAGRGLYILEDARETITTDTKVMLGLESVRMTSTLTLIDMLKIWTVEKNGVTVDQLGLYMRDKKPYYEKVIVPQLLAKAEERKKRLLERLKQKKN